MIGRYSALLARAAVFVLALTCAGAALAAQGGRFSDRLDALTHFAPVWLAGGAMAALLRRLVRRGDGGFVTVTLAGLAVLSSAWLMAPDLAAALTARRETAAPATLKIVQFNLWGRNAQPERTAAWILAQKPDVLVVEEMENGGPMARLLAPHFAHSTTCTEPHPCSTTLFYDRPALAESGFMTPDGTKLFLPAAWATLDDPAGPFTVFGAHHTWPLPAGPQQAQTRRLAEVMDRFDHGPMIVAGDFNSTPWSFSLRRQDRLFRLERRTRALPSWPAAAVSRWRLPAVAPVLPIDHVYAGPQWRTVSVERGPRLGSDHYPVVVTLARVRPARPSAAR